MQQALALQLEYHRPTRIEEVADEVGECLEELQEVANPIDFYMGRVYNFDDCSFAWRKRACVCLDDFARLFEGETVAAVVRDNDELYPYELRHDVRGIEFFALVNKGR